MKTTRPVFPTPAPSFTTSRLLLRPMTMADLSDLHILRTQHEVMKWTSTTKIDVDHAFTTTWMERSLPPNDSKTHTFVVEGLSNPGHVIGVLGSHVAEPPECGYMFRTEAWGKGYATEAMKAWLDVYWQLPRREMDVDASFEAQWRLEESAISREVLRAVTVDTNLGSQKVLQKCGFVQGGSEEVEENGGVVELIHFHLERPTK